MSPELRTVLQELQEKRNNAVTMEAKWRKDGESSIAMADAIVRKIADLDKAISALTPDDGKGLDGLLDHGQQVPDESSPQASETDAEVEDPTAVAIAKYIEAENADTPTEAERPSVVTDQDRVEQTPPPVPAVEIPEGFTKWEGGECPLTPTSRVDILTRGCGIWHDLSVLNASPLLWQHEGHDLDIIAYRIISEPAEEGEGEAATKLPPPDPFLTSIIERGGTWHDGGPNPAPNWFVDIYVPALHANVSEVLHLEGQPSNAYIWNDWEVAYVRTQPMFAEVGQSVLPAEGGAGVVSFNPEPTNPPIQPDTQPQPPASSEQSDKDEDLAKLLAKGTLREIEAKEKAPPRFMGLFGRKLEEV